MKKIIIFSILAGLFCLGYLPSFAAQTKKTKAKTVQTTNVIYETSQIKIIKQGNKYGVYDKKSQQYFVKPVLDNISTFSKNNDFEYKIISGDMIGYMNLITKNTFLSSFDDIFVLNNKYLKVRKGDNYGITDKKGKVIVPAEYQKVSVTQYDGTEYLIGKTDNKYNVFYNNGTIVSDNNFKSIDKTTYGSSIVRDLQPALKKYRDAVKQASSSFQTAYVVKQQEIDDTTVNLDTEDTVIEELPVPTTKRIIKQPVPLIKDEPKTSIVATNFREEEQPEVNVEELPLPSIVRKLTLKQDNYNKSTNENDAVEILTVNDKSYYITSKNGKLGLQTKHGRELIPARYMALKVKTLENQKGANEIIAAVDSKNTKLYDVSGDIIAKRFNNKINVYTSMRKYEYKLDENGIYIISFNNKKVGEIEVFKDGTYEYTRTGFNMSNMNKANELFLTLLKSEI